jgi:transposase
MGQPIDSHPATQPHKAALTGAVRIDGHHDLILGWIEAEPDLTLAEVAERLDKATGYRPLPSVVCRFFQRHGVTRKKRRRTPPSRTVPT